MDSEFLFLKPKIFIFLLKQILVFYLYTTFCLTDIQDLELPS